MEVASSSEGAPCISLHGTKRKDAPADGGGGGGGGGEPPWRPRALETVDVPGSDEEDEEDESYDEEDAAGEDAWAAQRPWWRDTRQGRTNINKEASPEEEVGF